jgi:hypothetical protein
MTAIMNIEEARRIVRETAPDWAAACEASGVLASSRESTFDDLLACLRHRGLPAESGACALYVRTKRPRRDDTLNSFVMAYDDWAAYLRERDFITQT